MDNYGNTRFHKVVKTTPYPTFAFEIWANGNADIHCAEDKELPMSPLRRRWWLIRGNVLAFLFSWWWWR